MGKVKRKGKTRSADASAVSFGDKVEKPRGLAEQIMDEPGEVKKSNRVKRRGVGSSGSGLESQNQEQVVSERLTAKILDAARKQQEELEEEHGCSGGKLGKQQHKRVVTTTVSSGARHEVGSDSEGSDSDDHQQEDVINASDYYEDIHLDPAEERALEMFMKSEEEQPAQRKLADIIKGKISEKHTEHESMMSATADGSVVHDLDPRVIEMYAGVKKVLSKYRSGKLPKAFKILPSLSNWEHLLYITEPEGWSSAAMYQATRIFSSNLNPNMAQRFYNLVLLPRIRDDIKEYKRLNFHLYAALQKAMFKPAAWFKGILLPLCESGSCTLREAVIVSSVVSKCTVPMLHSAACILKLCDMSYSGSNSIFLRALLDKRYALPYRVVDGLVQHFIRFHTDRRELPVLWHQSLLALVQHYRCDVSEEQRDALLALCRQHSHPGITAEVRRQLLNSTTRPQPATPVT